MIRPSLFVAPIAPTELDAVPDDRRYDVLLCSVGYETRSRAAYEALWDRCRSVKAVEFTHGHTDSYRINRQCFDAHETAVERFSDEEFVRWAPVWFEDRAQDSPRIAVDISSMSRPRIASVISALTRLPSKHSVVVDLLYVPARYAPPPSEVPDATEALAPVTREFAGEPADPERFLLLMFGLGYEPERAASAVDELAPEKSLPFFPMGQDDRFAHAVEAANREVLLIEDVEDPVPYSVLDPFRTFTELEAVIDEALRRDWRPLLLPLGPKIFAAVCMLAALSSQQRVPVWRVSSGPFEDPTDRQPENLMVGLRVSNQPIAVPGAERD